MFGLTNETRVYVTTGVTDGRVGFEGLRGLVSKLIAQDVRAGHLFGFAIAGKTACGCYGITRVVCTSRRSAWIGAR